MTQHNGVYSRDPSTKLPSSHLLSPIETEAWVAVEEFTQAGYVVHNKYLGLCRGYLGFYRGFIVMAP